jgi:6-phosphogluconolactonase
MQNSIMKRLGWMVFSIVPLLVLAGAVRASDDAANEAAGAVYTMTNAAEGNAILAFNRGADGTLSAAGSYPTGGVGSGDGLGNQGAVLLSDNHRWLYVVNAGSNDISVFAVRAGGLKLVDRVASGGLRPVSITADRDVVYVLNAGGDGNISGFTQRRHGRLVAIPGSTRPLSGANTGPAQISFNPDGDILVVTEKATNLIDTYVVNDAGLSTGPFAQNSVGATPFGFYFDPRGHLLVSEAVGGAVDAGTMSSYRVKDNGVLEVISPAVPTTETAICWVVVTKNGKYAYVSNAGSGSLSAYNIARNGSISLHDADGVTGNTGAGSVPIDIALSNNSRFIYSLNAGNGTLGAFRIQADGGLVALPGASGIPAGANGLAAY